MEAGANLFRQYCTSCHGRSGEGGQGEGQGPNLATSWEVRRAKDQELFGFIKNGVKGTAMPAFPFRKNRFANSLLSCEASMRLRSACPFPAMCKRAKQSSLAKDSAPRAI